MLKLLLGISFCLVFSAAKKRLGDDCITPPGKDGTCVDPKQCQYFRDPSNFPDNENRTQIFRKYVIESVKACDNSSICCNMELETVIYSEKDSPKEIPDVTNHRNRELLPVRCGGVFRNRASFESFESESPWTTLLFYSDNHLRCQGSVINKRYILTAARCITGLPKNVELSKVRVGPYDLSNTNFTKDFRIEKKHIHYGYLGIEGQNDIALLRLDADIDFDSGEAVPICLPIDNYGVGDFHKRATDVFGWGLTSNQGILNDKLRTILVEIVKNDECAKRYEGQKRIKNTQICTAPREKANVCIGDNGGPLEIIIRFGRYDRYVQYGINSVETDQCSPDGLPSVYTRVDYYMDWILNNIEE